MSIDSLAPQKVEDNAIALEQTITVRNSSMQIVRKPIKNLHLAVYPLDGNVRVSTPEHITNDNIRLAIISRLPWIKKQQAAFQVQLRQTVRARNGHR